MPRTKFFLKMNCLKHHITWGKKEPKSKMLGHSGALQVSTFQRGRFHVPPRTFSNFFYKLDGAPFTSVINENFMPEHSSCCKNSTTTHYRVHQFW